MTESEILEAILSTNEAMRNAFQYWLSIALALGWPAGSVKTALQMALFGIGTLTAEAYLVHAFVNKHEGAEGPKF